MQHEFCGVNAIGGSWFKDLQSLFTLQVPTELYPQVYDVHNFQPRIMSLLLMQVPTPYNFQCLTYYLQSCWRQQSLKMPCFQVSWAIADFYVGHSSTRRR